MKASGLIRSPTAIQGRIRRSSHRFGVWACFLIMASMPPVLSGEAAAQSGAELYRSGCAACHGDDGRGAPRTVVGFDTPLPDFTDCAFTTSEADVDWNAVVHAGGPVRALNRNMPAFGEALSTEQIQRVIEHIRGFCTSPAWPHGNLNLPRPLVTEKAFPENEAFARLSFPYSGFVETRFVFEARLGPRSQIELAVPFNVNHAFGGWQRGLGDAAVGFKHVLWHSHGTGSILSAGSDMTFPTGKEMLGLGNRLTVFEPFVVYSQTLPADGFVHMQAGFEAPLNLSVNKDIYWRGAIGKTFVEGQWGRAWSPLVEILAAREVEYDARTWWDVLPQLQVTLSRRQHLSASAGVRLPVNLPRRARPSLMFYLLWDWFDGGPFEGWR